MKKQKHRSLLKTSALVLAGIAMLLSGMAGSKASAGSTDGAGCRPVVTGDFIQSWYCSYWDLPKWRSHMDMLKRAGIDKLVIQSTADMDENGSFGLVLYDSEYIRGLDEGNQNSRLSVKPDALENMLKAAQEKGVKIFVGLNAPAAWWTESNMRSEKWYTEQATIANNMAEEIYGLYKAKYPDALYGWYWWPEMYTQNQGLETYWAKMLNISLDSLTTLDPDMPLLFSPFVSAYYNNTAEETLREWKNFMETARFRKGDIFCPQDSAGASGRTMEELKAQQQAQYEASRYNENVEFWVNVENFTADSEPAPVSRLIDQLAMAAENAKEIIIFSYSHYYDPGCRNPQFDQQYRDYAAALGQF